MVKILVSILLVILAIYFVICLLLFFYQEKLIFYPEKLSKDYKFHFNSELEEIRISTPDKINLHNLLFKTAKPKGVILYLHGNAGSLRSWGDVAEIYTQHGYDVLMLDYRGYGKSEGSIVSEKQMYDDVQLTYNYLKQRYNEQEIIVLGYSIGTGVAAKVASDNNPKMLILQAPFYSLKEVMKSTFPIIPTLILKYKFDNYRNIKQCKAPIVIFHGERDEIIDYRTTLRLKEFLKPADSFITLQNEGHNGMSSNPYYLAEIKRILSK